MLDYKRLNILFRNPFGQLVRVILTRLSKEIEELPDSSLCSLDYEELLNDYVERTKLGILPDIFWEQQQGEITKVKLIAKDLPQNFDRGFTGTIERKKVDIFIPLGEGRDDIMVYCGDNIDYSKHSTTTGYYSTKQFNAIGVPYIINRNKLQFTYIDYWNNADKINDQFLADKQNFQEHYEFLKTTVKNFEDNLPKVIGSFFDLKKIELKKDEDYMSRLAFPIKIDSEIPEVFIPKKVIKRKKIQPKKNSPITTSKEWYITENDYNSILKMLYDCGKMWEKYPRLYMNRDEESLRDQLLFVLVPNISAVLAGEAYNKKGKTDISIRHENSNLFIGECKIWKGQKVLKETIDQILNYLTWRDSKSAILNFVPNKDIERVIEEAEKAISVHPNFVRKSSKQELGWVNYVFRLNEESNSYLSMAFLFIHTPDL